MIAAPNPIVHATNSTVRPNTVTSEKRHRPAATLATLMNRASSVGAEQHEEPDGGRDKRVARLPAEPILDPLAEAARQRGEAQHERKHQQ